MDRITNKSLIFNYREIAIEVTDDERLTWSEKGLLISLLGKSEFESYFDIQREIIMSCDSEKEFKEIFNSLIRKKYIAGIDVGGNNYYFVSDKPFTDSEIKSFIKEKSPRN